MQPMQASGRSSNPSQAQSDLRFIYADEVKPILTKVVTVREKNVSANRILDQILPDVGLQYSVGGTQVRIYQAASGSRDVAQTSAAR